MIKISNEKTLSGAADNELVFYEGKIVLIERYDPIQDLTYIKGSGSHAGSDVCNELSAVQKEIAIY